MNAGIVSLQDGTPCIVYDEKLPYAISHVEFNEENHQLTLVYATPDSVKKQGREFEFPLDRPFVSLLRERGDVAIALVQNKQVLDIKVYSVTFVAA